MSDKFICYECQDGLCKNCIGVPCQCPCELSPSSSCSPPLDCTIDEFIVFLDTLQIGERVIERGQSCMKGETGTIVKTERGIGVKWDTKFKEGSGLVTSVTGGTRRVSEENSGFRNPKTT